MPYDVIIGRNEGDKKLFGPKGLVYLGKSYVTMGQYTSLSNPIYLDVARSHVILVSGKRGCLTGDTKVFTSRGYINIKDFNQQKDEVLSFNKEKKLFEWEKAELLSYPVSKEDLIELELEDGRIICLTKEHPLLINYGKYIFWRQAQELKIHDKVVIPLILPEIKKDTESLRIARILGFVLSDGTISKRQGRWRDGRGYWYNGIKSRLRIFCDDNSVLTIAKEDLEKEFGLYVKKYARNDCNCSVIQSLHAKVVDKINKLGVPLGNKAGIIRVPQIVWESSNEFKANFISALFSCDGYVKKRGEYVDYSSKSRKFLEDLQILLAHFKIESSIRIKNAKLNGKIYKNYRLFITDNSSIENFKKIGFFSDFKKERLALHKKYNTKRRKTFYFSDNLVCKRVKHINNLSGINEVYDLSVNNNHSFIANGIVSHNSGKSYTIGAMAEAISSLPHEESQNMCSLMFDTMGIFWTMKFKNQKDKELLDSWGLKAQNVPVRVFAPFGYFQEYKDKGIPVDFEFAIKLNEMQADDWISIFNLNFTDSIAVLIEKAISELREKENFSFADIKNKINENKQVSSETKNSAIALFEAAETWKVFSDTRGLEISQIVSPGTSSVMDLSMYSSIGSFNVRALIIGIVCRKLFEERMASRKNEEIQAVQHGLDYLYFNAKREMPLVWIFIDEAHEFLIKEGKTPASDALIQLLREGRQPGISLVLATQQPGKIHTDALTQADIVLSHRVTAQLDVQALNEIMQSYLYEGIKTKLDNLPKLRGSAIILDDNSERIYPMRVRPRFTWHGGEAPTAVKVEKEGRL